MRKGPQFSCPMGNADLHVSDEDLPATIEMDGMTFIRVCRLDKLRTGEVPAYPHYLVVNNDWVYQNAFYDKK